MFGGEQPGGRKEKGLLNKRVFGGRRQLIPTNSRAQYPETSVEFATQTQEKTKKKLRKITDKVMGGGVKGNFWNDRRK